MPTTAIIHFTAAPGQRDALLAFLEGVQDAAIAAGCHSIAVHRDVDEPDKVFEVEYWDSKEDHERFVKGAADAGAFAPFETLLAGPFSIAYGEPTKRTKR
jgi:quinol monooxygenase YgiN